MEKDKYYTPRATEFHIGFEYEEFCIEWLNGLFEFYDTFEVLEEKLSEGLIRVKYLSREDIESFGFQQVNEEVTYYTLNNFNLFFEYTKPTILIDQRIIGSNGGYYDFRLFKGIAKNKSEFSRLLKQLSII